MIECMEVHLMHILLWTLYFTASSAPKLQVWHSPPATSLVPSCAASESGNSWTGSRSHLPATSSISTLFSVCQPPLITFTASTPAPVQPSLYSIHSALSQVTSSCRSLVWLLHLQSTFSPSLLTALHSLFLHPDLPECPSSTQPGSLFSHYLFNKLLIGSSFFQ